MPPPPPPTLAAPNKPLRPRRWSCHSCAGIRRRTNPPWEWSLHFCRGRRKRYGRICRSRRRAVPTCRRRSCRRPRKGRRPRLLRHCRRLCSRERTFPAAPCGCKTRGHTWGTSSLRWRSGGCTWGTSSSISRRPTGKEESPLSLCASPSSPGAAGPAPWWRRRVDWAGATRTRCSVSPWARSETCTEDTPTFQRLTRRTRRTRRTRTTSGAAQGSAVLRGRRDGCWSRPLLPFLPGAVSSPRSSPPVRGW